MIGMWFNFNKRYLTSMEKEYLYKLKDWRNAQMNILRQTVPLTNADQRRWFRNLKRDDKQIIFAILEPEKQSNMKFMGYCGITSIDFYNRNGEISFLVDPVRTLDKKLYKEDFISVLYMLCRYGFEKIDLHKIYTETFAFRKYHMEILEEFGFHIDGILRQRKFVSGKYYDSLVHSILEKEWPRIKERTMHVLEG